MEIRLFLGLGHYAPSLFSGFMFPQTRKVTYFRLPGSYYYAKINKHAKYRGILRICMELFRGKIPICLALQSD